MTPRKAAWDATKFTGAVALGIAALFMVLGALYLALQRLGPVGFGACAVIGGLAFVWYLTYHSARRN